MITLFFHYALIMALVNYDWATFLTCLPLIILWDIIWIIVLCGGIGNTNAHRRSISYKKDPNDGYHYVDWDNNGKIDWYEL